MTPAARLQAAIELVDAIIEATRSDGAAADTLIARYFKERRYAGSKDRRAIRDLVYAAIRRYRTAPANGRAALLGLAEDQLELRALFDGSPYGPGEIAANERAEIPAKLPEWLQSQFSQSLSEDDIASLSGRAPLDIRVNLARLSREEALGKLGEEAQPGELSASAVRLPNGFAVEQHALWQDGLIDVQDEGSQVIADVCDVQTDSTVLDLCAGAGGKTLALHDQGRGSARLIASDTDRRRLSRLDPRSTRQKARNIETRLIDGGKEREALADLRNAVDCVLIDAPCSGTGTWRRNPEAAWRLTPDNIGRYTGIQRHLLDIGAETVAPGGFLVYAVCSLLRGEGEEQMSAFLDRHSGFRKVAPANATELPAGDGFLLTPARHGSDGFFFARLERSC